MIIEYSVMCGVKESSVFHQNSMSNSMAIMDTESPGGIRRDCKSLYIKDSQGDTSGSAIFIAIWTDSRDFCSRKSYLKWSDL